MLDMKMQSDMMNEMLNRNYDMDYDEDEFEDEFMEFEKEVATEKKKTVNPMKKQEIQKNSMDIDSFLK
jgi:preprotein translocase subunit SecE